MMRSVRGKTARHVQRHAGSRRLGRAVLLLAGLGALPALGQVANPWTPPGTTAPPLYAGDAAGFLPGMAPATGPTGLGWAGPQAASRFAPPGLEARLSGVGPVAGAALPALPMPTAQAPGADSGLYAAPLTAPTGGFGAVPVTPVVPGVASYPGALPYGAGAGTGVAPATPGYGSGIAPGAQGYGVAPGYGYGTGVAPGAQGYGAAPGYGYGVVPGTQGYGYGAAPGYGYGAPGAQGYGYGYGAPGYGTAVPYGAAPGWPGYTPGWGGGTGGWPGTGFGSGFPGTGISPFGFW